MKKSLKYLSVILVMLITLFSFSITALAQTTEQDGLQVSLTTDKQSYSLNEDIEITVSVTNTNDFTVEDVSIEALLPDNFELKDSKQETSTKAIDLKAGEKTNLSVTAVVKDNSQGTVTEPTTKPTESITENNQNTKPSEQTTTAINSDNNSSDKSDNNTNSKNNKNGTSPYTGADYTFMGIFLVLFLASVATLFYCLIKHFKKTTKIVSSVLCAVIAVTSVIGFSTFKAFADENKSTITVSEQIKVDNNDYTINANVDYKFNYDISLTNFKADTFDIYLNEEKLVTFTCNVNSNTKIRNKDIVICSGENKFIAYMNDDGVNGDLLANDGIYSGQSTLSSSEFKLEDYYATAFDCKSNIFEINFYRNLTDEEFSSFDKLHTYITSLSFSEACNYVKKSDEINTYSIDKQNKNITYNSIYHITGIWEEEKDNSLKGSGEFSIPMIFERDYERAKPIVDKLYFSSKLKKKDVMVMRPFRNSGFEYDDFKYSGELLSTALNSNLTVKDDEAVTLSEMKNLGDYGIVLIDSHGTLINGNTPNIIIGEKYKENQSYSADYSSGTINCIGTEKNLTVGRRFIEKYYQDKSLINSFLFLGTCYSSYANDLPISLLNAGATSVIGFTDTVSVGYCNNTLFETVINSMLLSADTLENGVNSTKDFYGEYDPYNSKCELIIQGLISYRIVDMLTDAGSIIGRVKEQGTNAPISNREVKIYNENYTSDNAMYTFVDKTKTNSNGSFNISLPAGTYTLVIDNDGENSNSDYYYDTVEMKVKVDAGVDTVLLNDIILARRENGITGYVYDNDDLINNGKNTPIADVTVEVYQNNNGTTDYIGKCKTDENGKYTFAVDKNYGYTLVFIKSGYKDTEEMVVVNGGFATCNAYLTKDSLVEETRTVIDSGDCGANGDNVKWTLYEDGELVISGKGEMKDYYAYNYDVVHANGTDAGYTNAPWYSKEVKTIKVNNGVTSIGTHAFSLLKDLTDVFVSNSVSNLNYGAFGKSRNLKNVVFEKNSKLQIIDGHCFDNCKKLKNINIDTCNSLQTIGYNAFGSCGLEKLVLVDSITFIGSYAFANCFYLNYIEYNIKNLQDYGNKIFNSAGKYSDELKVVFSDNVMSIPDELFVGNNVNTTNAAHQYANLTSLVIGENVSNIGKQAFYDCRNLNNIIILSKRISSIGWQAFSATAVYNNDSNWQDNVLYIGKNLIKAKETISDIYLIKDKTECIADGAFYNCNQLTKVIIPNSVTDIGDDVFGWCQNLKSIVIPSSVTSIGKNSFYYCKSLESITINNCICEIYDDKSTISDTAIIYAHTGSTAETYAKKYNRNFVSID